MKMCEMCVCVCIQLYLTLCNPWTVAFQSLSMEFFRHGMNSNPSSGHLPDPGIKAMSSVLQTDSSPPCHLGSLANENIFILSGLGGIYNFIYKPRVFKVTHLLKMILRKVQYHLLGLKPRVQRSFLLNNSSLLCPYNISCSLFPNLNWQKRAIFAFLIGICSSHDIQG